MARLRLEHGTILPLEPKNAVIEDGTVVIDGATIAFVGPASQAPSDPEGDDEVINVDLSAVPQTVSSIVFPVSIYEGDARGQSFGQVRNAFIRVVNQSDSAELARYDLSEDASTETAMVFGELYRAGAEWKFRAVGQGYATGLRGIAQDFGVNV